MDIQHFALCRDETGEDSLVVNFDTDLKASFFAKLYQHSGLQGGHVVMLGADEDSRCDVVTPAERTPWAWQFCSTPFCSIADTLRRTAAILVAHPTLPAACELCEYCRYAALEALMAYPGGLQLGGGVTNDNAAVFLNAGASHVIVTSFVFREGRLEEDRLKHLVSSIRTHPSCLFAPIFAPYPGANILSVLDVSLTHHWHEHALWELS